MSREDVTNIEAIVRGHLCQGCGACEYACESGAIELRNFIEVGIRPVVDAAKCVECGECVDVCSGITLDNPTDRWPLKFIDSLKEGWGPVLEIWEGHACDPEIRFKGGSGGAATALASYCIERENMHGVLHVRMDENQPHLNRTVFSRDRGELIRGTGSRYAPASVCADLGMIEDAPSPCVMIAKPCEIAAAQMARKIRPKLDHNLGLSIAIFCGGTPSTRGTLELLRSLGVEKGNINDLRYRGHGWPGMTGVSLKTNGRGRVEMTYQRAWDSILTKHKPFRCHLCPDGTGEFADLSCGDPWYRSIEEGEAGNSLIIVRTEVGRRIIRGAMESGYVMAEARDPEILPRSQRGLLARRQRVWPKLVAMRCFGLPRATFKGMSLRRCWFRLEWKDMVISLWRALRYARHLRRVDAIDLNDPRMRESVSIR